MGDEAEAPPPAEEAPASDEATVEALVEEAPAEAATEEAEGEAPAAAAEAGGGEEAASAAVGGDAEAAAASPEGEEAPAAESGGKVVEPEAAPAVAPEEGAAPAEDQQQVPAAAEGGEGGESAAGGEGKAAEAPAEAGGEAAPEDGAAAGGGEEAAPAEEEAAAVAPAPEAEVEVISEALPQSANAPRTGGSTLSGTRKIEVDMGRELPPVRITLEIESDAPRKPFFGGFRHKITGIEYHHANCQTEAPPKPQRSAEDLAPPKFHRDTQTKKTNEKAQQALREHGTQMPRDDHYEDVRGDYIIEPRPYLDSEQWAKVRLKATNVIQCYTRGMFARSLARKFKAELEYNRQYYLEMQARQEKETGETREREIERRIHPKSAKDFEILYKELEAWRVSETQRIEVQDVSGAEKQVARYQLLLKEVKLVQTIDKLKSSAKKENDAEAVAKLLSDMSQPKLWEMSDGAIKEVQTPYTIRAKELSDLYQGMSLTNLRVDERLDVLLHVKWTVKEFDTKLTRELVELIDREADLLNRGRSDKALEGLRKRTLRNFLQFIQTPAYNPEVANFPEAKML